MLDCHVWAWTAAFAICVETMAALYLGSVSELKGLLLARKELAALPASSYMTTVVR